MWTISSASPTDGVTGFLLNKNAGTATPGAKLEKVNHGGYREGIQLSPGAKILKNLFSPCLKKNESTNFLFSSLLSYKRGITFELSD